MMSLYLAAASISKITVKSKNTSPTGRRWHEQNPPAGTRRRDALQPFDDVGRDLGFVARPRTLSIHFTFPCRGIFSAESRTRIGVVARHGPLTRLNGGGTILGVPSQVPGAKGEEE